MPLEDTPRRRGRPKTTGARDNAEELRRQQIRNAQRTYRLRRDNRIRAMEEAHAELKARSELMEKTLLAIREDAEGASCELAGSVLRRTEQFFRDEVSSRSPSSSDPLVAVHPGADTSCDDSLRSEPAGQTFGYLVTPSQINTHLLPLHPASADAPPFSLPSILPSPLPPRTYTPQETTFARRLHRLTLEQAYKTFATPSSPHSVYRTFRLVPCFKDPDKMRPYFLRLLRSDAGQGLELYGLPFYRIGGAGTHYPRIDGEKSNLRFPRRILGIGDAGWEGYEERLRAMGYGGVWFDSYEVECYLRERGICPLAHSSVVPVRLTLPGSKSDTEGTTLRNQPSSTRPESPEILPDQEPGNGSDTTDSASTTSRYFDTDSFLECLSSTASILGRAPGFRKDSVEAAIRQAIWRGERLSRSGERFV